jgi:hypothetical protein
MTGLWLLPKKAQKLNTNDDDITLHCTFTVYCTLLYIYSVLSLSVVIMKVRDYDILALVRRKRKMIEVLGVFELLDFTMIR